MKIEIIEVSGEGCANCFTLLPVLSKLAAERELPLRHVEVTEKNGAEVRRLGIERVPTVILMGDGAEIARCAGFQPEEILEVWLDAKIEEAKNLREKKI